MNRIVIGTDPRWFIGDDIEELMAGLGEPILIGIDLGSQPSMSVEVEIGANSARIIRTHPTTARELRRAERRRKHII